MAFLLLHVNPFVVVHPMHILVHRAHRLKSADLDDIFESSNTILH